MARQVSIAAVVFFVCVGLGVLTLASPVWLSTSCKKDNFPLQACESILAAWKSLEATPREQINRFCFEASLFKEDADQTLCMQIIESGIFDENGHKSTCKEHAEDLAATFCPKDENEIKAAAKLSLLEDDSIVFSEQTTSPLSKRMAKRNLKQNKASEQKELLPQTSFLQEAAKASTKVPQCVPVAPGTNLVLDNSIGTPVSVIIDKPLSSAKLNRERPYMEPAIRVFVSALNTGCVLNVDGAWAFCNGALLAPHNDHRATQCAGGGTPALLHANCANGAIGGNLGNFFTIGGGGGWLFNTFYGGNPVAVRGQADGPWLWMIDSCGNLKMGEEHQPRNPPVTMLNGLVNRGVRAIKHGDLNPTVNGNGREVGRTGGEFKLRTPPGGAQTWFINSCSSYFTLRRTNFVGFPTSLGRLQLCRAVAYMTGLGLNPGTGTGVGTPRIMTCKDWYRNHGQPDYARCLDCGAALVNGKPPFVAC